MKKLFTLLIGLAFIANSIFAAPISKESAARVVHNFLLQKQMNNKTSNTDFSFYKTFYVDNTAVYHVFTFNETGFIAISASDHFTPVLCYSFESDYQPNVAFDFAMDKYARWIAYCEKNNQDFSADVTSDWEHYAAPDFTAEPLRGIPVVGPLLTTLWDQGLYFNTYCPWDASSYYGDSRVVTGCVATAMGQVMNYYGHPSSGEQGSSYIPEPYGRYTIRFYEYDYNYASMPNSPNTYCNELAKLLHHCGVAVQMGYTPSGSGANSVSAIDAMKRHFKYAPNAQLMTRLFYDDNDGWHNALKSELNQLRPLYYAANDGQGGHAFVVDGYDEDGKFHVNWGWSGSSNGYFTISDTDNSDMLGYIYGAEFGRFTYPREQDAPAPCAGFQRNDAAIGKITTGMPTSLYSANADCQWMLAAPEASRYTLKFDRLETEQDVDIVTIYNGPTPDAGVAGTFSGTSLPTSSITVNADSVLVTFTSNAENQLHGFQISYQAVTAAQYCDDAASITGTETVTITDGSGNNPYRNNSNCTWNITTPNMSKCYFSFPQLELGEGDFIEIYNSSTTPATLLYRFDNRNYPQNDVITCENRKLKVRFIADNWNVGNGFSMTVQPVTAVNDYANIRDLKVYPNPVKDVLNLNFVTEETGVIVCEIVDMNGKLLRKIEQPHQGGLFEHQFGIDDLSEGIYFLRIRTNEGSTMEKFVKTK